MTTNADCRLVEDHRNRTDKRHAHLLIGAAFLLADLFSSATMANAQSSVRIAGGDGGIADAKTEARAAQRGLLRGGPRLQQRASEIEMRRLRNRRRQNALPPQRPRNMKPSSAIARCRVRPRCALALPRSTPRNPSISYPSRSSRISCRATSTTRSSISAASPRPTRSPAPRTPSSGAASAITATARSCATACRWFRAAASIPPSKASRC